MANEFKIRKGLIVTGASGGTVVDIQGSQGQLFSVTDDLSGSIFAVSDISGVPIFDVNSSGLSTFDGLVSGITPVAAANFVTKAYVDGSGGGTGPFLPLAGGTLTGTLISTQNNGAPSIYINSSRPTLGFTDTNSFPDPNDIYLIRATSGAKLSFNFYDDSASTTTETFNIDPSGNATFAGSITIPDYIYHTSDPNTFFGFDGNDQIAIKTSGNYNFFGDANATGLYAAGGVKLKTNNVSVGTATTTGGTLIDGWITTTQANAVNNTTIATTAYVNNKIALIPAGLVFQGTWNAATNTPPLTSGSGTTGNFYIVSVPGNTNLDGITDWKTGDWAVFIEQGASDQWEKIDNSSVLDGFGTGQTLPLWSGSGTSNTLTDSYITQNTALANDIIIPQYIRHTGDTNTLFGFSQPDNFIINTNNANALTINSAQNATFAGDVTISTSAFSQLDIITSRSGATDNIGGVQFYKSSTLKGQIFGVNDGKVKIATNGNTVALTLDESQNATFAGSINGGDINLSSTNNAIIDPLSVGNILRFTDNDPTQNNNQITGTIEWETKDSNNPGIQSFITTNSTNQGKGRLVFGTGLGGSAVEKMRIDSDGNVGIGVTEPDNKLMVQGASTNGAASAGNVALFEGPSGTNGLKVFVDDTENAAGFQTISADDLLINPHGGNVGIGTAGPISKFTVTGTDNTHQANIGHSTQSVYIKVNGTNVDYNSSGNSSGSHTFSTGNIERMRITSGGSVLVNTTSEQYVSSGRGVIEINGDTGAGKGSLLGLKVGNTHGGYILADSTQMQVYNHLATPLRFFTNANERMLIDSAGTLLLKSGAFPTNQDAPFLYRIGGGSLAIGSATETGSGAHVALYTNSLERMRITSSGNVGIGTTGPGFKLEVDTNGVHDGIKIRGANAPGLTLQDDSSASLSTILIQSTAAAQGNLRIAADTNNVATGATIEFQVSGSERMRISNAGAVRFNDYGAGTLVTDSSGNITVSSGGGAGGPYLPLSAGSGFPLTGDLHYNGSIRSTTPTSKLILSNSSTTTELHAAGSGGTAFKDSSNGTKMVIDSSGNVGIGTTGPVRKLDVAGITKTIGFQNTNNYVEGFLFANFANGVANQNYDIQLGNISFWGYIEVEITGTYSNQNTAGKLTKIYAVGVNPATSSAAGIIYTNETRVSDSIGTIKDNIALGNFRFDGTDDTGVFAIRVSHIVSTGNGYTIKVRVFTHGSNGSNGATGILTNLNLSSIYTQTALSRQYVYYNYNVGIGTTTPDNLLHVQGSNNPRIDLGEDTNNKGWMRWNNADNYIDFTTRVGGTYYADTLVLRNGNVGIGTTTPNNLLSLRKDVADGDVAIYLQNYNSVIGSTNETVSIKFAHGNDSGTGYVGAAIVGGKEGDFESNPSNVKGFISFNTNNGSVSNVLNERMRIEAGGNVGIGTTNPGEPLTVKTKTDAYFPGIKVEDYDSSMGLYIQNLEGYNSGIGTGRYYNSNFWRSDVTAPTTIRLDGGAIRFYAQSGVTADANYTPTQRMNIAATGAIKFNAYDSTNNTGTPTYILGTDASGNVVKVLGGDIPGGGGTVTGTGVATRVAFWSGTSSLSADSNLYWDDTNNRLGVGTAGPVAKLSVVGSGENGGIFFGNSGAQEHRFYSSTNSQFNTIGSSSPIWYWAQYTGVGVAPNYKMTLNNTGLGVGTTSPQSKLHLVTTGGSTLTIQNTTNSGNAALNFRDEGNNDQFQIYYALGANRSYNSVNGNGLTIYSSQSSSEIARFGNASSGYTDSYFTGNVGIGTTTPLAKLDIQGTLGQLFSVTDNLSGSIFAVADISGVPILDVNSSGVVTIDDQLTVMNIVSQQIINAISIDSNTFAAGTRFEAAPGSKGAPSYTFTADLDTGMFLGAVDNLHFTVGGDENLQISSGYLDITQYIRHIGDADTYFGFNAVDQFQITAGGNTNLNIQGNGVTLSYAGSSKLNTQTGGVAVTGELNVGTSKINSSGDSYFLGGDVGIGTSSPDVLFHVSVNEDGSGIDKGAAKFVNTNTGQGATTMHMVQTSSSSFANAVKFWQGSTPTPVGFIRLTTSATQFITSASDLNLKKNITNWNDDTLSKFKALEPKKFRFKTQDVSEDKTLGFIAQNEVNNFPEAYPQFLGEDEQPYYGFNPSGMVPHLMKAIKDLVEKVETLENRITQLEN